MIPRRAVIFLGFCFILALFLTAHILSHPHLWNESLVQQAVTLGKLADSYRAHNLSLPSAIKAQPYAPSTHYVLGTPKPLGSEYTKNLVVARTRMENVSWIEQELPDWKPIVYVADDPKAPLHPPQNKGNEVMIYLSYCIEYYDQLPDVSLFIHAHRNSWHNDDVFGGDTAKTIRHLSLDRVAQEGYVNIRCKPNPGCPGWILPGIQDWEKPEQAPLGRAWSELFPEAPLPSVLGQPCCAQFALTRDRIRTIPRSRFIYFRDWLLQTDATNEISGKMWEYLWQYVFTGNTVFCSEEIVCLCDMYGVCFSDVDELQRSHDVKEEKDKLQEELDSLGSTFEDHWQIEEEGNLDGDLEISPDARKGNGLKGNGRVGNGRKGNSRKGNGLKGNRRKDEIQRLIKEKEEEMERLFTAAIEHGKDRKPRGLAAGQP